MAFSKFYYVKLDENNKVINLPMNDFDGKITGKCVFGLAQYFDENPKEVARCGVFRVVDEGPPEFDKNTEFIDSHMVPVGKHEYRKVYDVYKKTAEMLAAEEGRGEVYGYGIFNFDTL